MAEPRPQNPYNAETPAEDPTMFFGRRQVLDEIVKRRIKHAHPISTILIGGRKIGKTSLLFQIRDRLLRQPGCGTDIVIPAFITFHRRTSLDTSTVFEEMISGVARSLREHRGLQVSPGDLVGDPYEAFRQQMRMIWHQCGEQIGSVRFFILIDEADRLLGHSWTKDVISNLRDLINTSDQRSYVALVVTGFRELHDYALMEEEGIGSAFGNTPRWTNLSVLTEAECSDLVTVPLHGEVSERVVASIYERSGGHPYIAQYLMQEIWKPNPAEITPTDVKRACNRFKKEVKVFPSWRKRFTALDEQVYRVLTQAQEPLALGEIHKRTAVEAEPGEIEDSLGFLDYTGVIAERDEKYAAAGRLFRDWFLKRNRKEKSIGKSSNQPEHGRGVDTKRLLGSVFAVLLIFVVTVVVLAWAAQRVSPVALAFVLVVAVVFDLVGIVSVLALIDLVPPGQAMNFLNAVLKRVPMLKLSLYPQSETGSTETEELQDTEVEGGSGEEWADSPTLPRSGTNRRMK